MKFIFVSMLFLVSVYSQAQTIKCYNEGKKLFGTILINKDHADLFNWGGHDYRHMDMAVKMEKGVIKVDYGRDNFAKPIILTEKSAKNYKYDYISIDKNRTDTCIQE